MLTPEIQQYISQQRSAGVSDAQIRQTLSVQGWSQADLDQVFGTATVIHENSSGHRKSILILLVIVLLVLGAWKGYSYYAYQQAQKADCCGDAKQSSQGISPSPVNQNASSGQKLCGSWPQYQADSDYLMATKLFSKIDSSTTASGIPIYSGASKITQIDSAGNEQVIACARSTTVATIMQYYQAMPGYQVAPPSFLNSNTALGSLHPQAGIGNSTALVFIYDAGAGDVLLFYVHN